MEETVPGVKHSKLEEMRKRIKFSVPNPLMHPQIETQIESQSTVDQQSQVSISPVTPYTQMSGLSFLNFFKTQTSSKNAFEELYQILEKLGQGASGVIRRCQHRITGKIEAVKIGEMEQEQVIIMKRTIKILKKVDNDHILRMKQLYIDSQRHKYYQVMEYLPHPSVKKLMLDEHYFTEEEIRLIMKQLFEALDHFRAHRIVHRDIKTDNLIYDVLNQHLYVIDLGLVTKTVERGRRRNLWTNTGTLEYKAPETLEYSSYNEAVDMWAAGVVLYELVERRTPFKEPTQFQTIENIVQIKYTFKSHRWQLLPLAKALVQRILKPKNQRLSSTDALKDPWFQLMEYNQKPISPMKKQKFASYNSSPLDHNPFRSEEQRNHTGQQGEDGEIDRSELLRAFSYNENVPNHHGSAVAVKKCSKQLFEIAHDPKIINNNN